MYVYKTVIILKKFKGIYLLKRNEMYTLLKHVKNFYRNFTFILYEIGSKVKVSHSIHNNLIFYT